MRRILAVDDDKDILEVIQFILEDSGYEVETLSDGHYLMERLHQNMPDLILLDIMLGNLDGRKLCKDVKTDPFSHNIPVIMISASHTVSCNKPQQGCPDDFIAKPFDINTLLNKVKIHLKLNAA